MVGTNLEHACAQLREGEAAEVVDLDRAGAGRPPRARWVLLQGEPGLHPADVEARELLLAVVRSSSPGRTWPTRMNCSVAQNAELKSTGQSARTLRRPPLLGRVVEYRIDGMLSPPSERCEQHRRQILHARPRSHEAQQQHPFATKLGRNVNAGRRHTLGRRRTLGRQLLP